MTKGIEVIACGSIEPLLKFYLFLSFLSISCQATPCYGAKSELIFSKSIYEGFDVFFPFDIYIILIPLKLLSNGILIEEGSGRNSAQNSEVSSHKATRFRI